MIFKNYYDYFIIFIIVVKVIYYSIYVIDFLLKLNEKHNLDIYIKLEEFKKILNITFNTSMAILLLYLFNPFYKSIEIDKNVKGLLFLYAIILFLSNIKYVNEDNIIKYIRLIFT